MISVGDSDDDLTGSPPEKKYSATFNNSDNDDEELRSASPEKKYLANFISDNEDDDLRSTSPEEKFAPISISDNDDDELTSTSPEEKYSTKLASLNTLPEKSRKKYELVYRQFMEWRDKKNTTSFSEKVLLVYFEELSKKYKSTSLWAYYSMLRSTLTMHHSINIETYASLRAFLKRQSVGYIPKKSKTFTPSQIQQFLDEAPDDTHLATKVALIMGLMGGCQTAELHLMEISHCEDLGVALLVTVPNKKNQVSRNFTITGKFYEICKKYITLRPEGSSCPPSFFLHYRSGKCMTQKIGINKFGVMGKQIAAYLKLPDPETYTGHTFRRSSISTMNRYRGSRTASIVEEFVDDSYKIKMNSANKIVLCINEGAAGTSTSIPNDGQDEQMHENINLNTTSNPVFNISNCSNFTINVYPKKD